MIEDFDRLKDAKAKYPDAVKPVPSKEMALDFVMTCIIQAEADGYQQNEQMAWQDFIGEVVCTDSEIIVMLGSKQFSLKAREVK